MKRFSVELKQTSIPDGWIAKITCKNNSTFSTDTWCSRCCCGTLIITMILGGYHNKVNTIKCVDPISQLFPRFPRKELDCSLDVKNEDVKSIRPCTTEVRKRTKAFLVVSTLRQRRDEKNENVHGQLYNAGWRDIYYYLIQALIYLFPEAWDYEDEWNSLHCCFSMQYATCIIWHSQFRSILHFGKHIKTSVLFSSKYEYK